eukprot:TRINITY_DN2347_c0_g2_i5.p1 TRINITY_DN2347_c0_g2~~TRINITY_DN2347_c0_g2_i5.p1  ORF type:complete len:295 (+),score=68.61 TRINITY_DN2347_c0_g2_i5:66-950(+)
MEGNCFGSDHEELLNKHDKIFDSALDTEIEKSYLLGKKIGRGRFSTVVEATSKKDNHKYAVKIIEKYLIHETNKREIDFMKRLEHPNIVKLYEIYESKEIAYIVLELVDGGSLFDRIVEKGYYSEKNAIIIVKQILSAVDYLHKQGIVHRDLKPENFLCSGQGEDEIIKIADFSFSKLIPEDDQLMVFDDYHGSLGNVAAEIIWGKIYNKPVDMWGIGTVTYILLGGYPPFYAESETALFDKIVNAEYDFDDECWDDISDLAKDFIRHLIVKDPNERLSAPQALKHAWLAHYNF